MTYGNWYYGGSSYGTVDGFDGMGNKNPSWTLESALSRRETGACFDQFGNILSGLSDTYALGESYRQEERRNSGLSVQWKNMIEFHKESTEKPLNPILRKTSGLDFRITEKLESNLKGKSVEDKPKMNPRVTILCGQETIVGQRQEPPKQKLIIYTSTKPNN